MAYLVPFASLTAISIESRKFFSTPCIYRPRWGFPLELGWPQKTATMGKSLMISLPILIQYANVTDRRTDRQRPTASTALTHSVTRWKHGLVNTISRLGAWWYDRGRLYSMTYYVPAPRIGGIKRWCASDVCLSVCLSVWRLSVAYIGPKSRTEKLRKTKIGSEVATPHVTLTQFQGQR